jgi:very long chain acyl-CoA dehydrogenase
LLVKYGKGIVEEQFLLNRLADSAIDIYAMSVCLSRASRAIINHFPTAEHEQNMTEAWCLEASDRVKVNLRKASSGEFVNNYRKMSQISKAVCAEHDVAHQHPLNL